MHSKKVCEFGKVHTQCRCPSKDKTVIKIKCDIPNAHSPAKPASVYLPPEPVSVNLNVSPPWEDIVDDFLSSNSLPNRLDRVLHARLWWMKDSERASLLSDIMEQINNT